MNEQLKKFENILFKICRQKISNIYQDNKSEEYCGYNFTIDKSNIKFRKAKITPKKTGQFVTLWKRNSNNETEPFNENDNFDFYIIVTEDGKKSGFLIFPKHILIEKKILSTK